MATQFSVNDGVQWKNRFFTIWGGQALSLLGSQLVGFAIIWYLTVESGSATVLVTATLVGMLPSMVLGAFVGPLIDRWNRRIEEQGIALRADNGDSFAIEEPVPATN